MSKDILNSLVGQYKFSAELFDKFIEICPDKIWAAPTGKFPAWQTVYHALACVTFFLGPKDDAPAFAPLYGREVLMFQDLSQPPADKKALAEYAKKADAFADSIFASLTDVDLGKMHEGFNARTGRETSVAGVITSLSGHHLYHFGACDAALRNNGMEGLF